RSAKTYETAEWFLTRSGAVPGSKTMPGPGVDAAFQLSSNITTPTMMSFHATELAFMKPSTKGETMSQTLRRAVHQLQAVWRYPMDTRIPEKKATSSPIPRPFHTAGGTWPKPKRNGENMVQRPSSILI